MNRKGQTLVAFVIIIPILIILMAFVVDTGISLKEKTKLNSVTKTIIKNYYDDLDTKARDLFSKNNIPTDNLNIKIQDNQIYLENNYEIASIFGNIIGIKNYKIKIKVKAYKNKEEQIIIEKE